MHLQNRKTNISYPYIYIHIYMVLIEMSTTLTETRASTVLYACFFLGGGREFCR